jgi:hypothetical protein
MRYNIELACGAVNRRKGGFPRACLRFRPSQNGLAGKGMLTPPLGARPARAAALKPSSGGSSGVRSGFPSGKVSRRISGRRGGENEWGKSRFTFKAAMQAADYSGLIQSLGAALG